MSDGSMARLAGTRAESRRRDPVRLLINGESLLPPRTGIGIYTSNLISEFVRLEGLVDAHVVLGRRLLNAGDALQVVQGLPRTPGRTRKWSIELFYRLAARFDTPYRLYQARNRSMFARVSGRLQAGAVYHEPNFVLKPFDGPSVITIHDLSFIHYPAFHPKARVRFLKHKLRDSVRRAGHIVTVSALVRGEIIQMFDVSPDKVSAIPLGVAPEFLDSEPPVPEGVLARHGLQRGNYILCVSTLEPRKNLATLLAAWQSLPDSFRKEFRLVIVGASGWQSGRLARKLQADPAIVWPGYVPRSHLPALYAGSRLFVFPSVYEGFGLPVLEAMASGAAVIAGVGTAMAEFAGESIHQVDVRDPSELGRAIETLSSDEPRRQQLSELARARARNFRWDNCARQHVEIYRKVLGQ